MKIFSIVILLVMVSCVQKSAVEESNVDPVLSFRTETLVRESCVGENCAKLRLSWPVASGPAVAGKINRYIRDQLSLFVQTDEDAGILDTMIVAYFRSFDEFKSEFPESAGGWEIEAEARVTYQSDSTLSIHFSQFSYLGGAHPNSVESFLNIDPKSGDVLSIDRLVLDKNSLLKLTEQKFREYHEVEEGVSLSRDGRFFLPETGFFLANAMGFRDGKFWVIYIPYEIGPYVMGSTELEFSKEELAGLVRW
jgi:hypothetical protein